MTASLVAKTLQWRLKTRISLTQIWTNNTTELASPNAVKASITWTNRTVKKRRMTMTMARTTMMMKMKVKVKRKKKVLRPKIVCTIWCLSNLPKHTSLASKMT